MKKIIIFIMLIGLVACQQEDLLSDTIIKSKQQLTYQLKQVHFVVLTKIEYYFCLGDDSSTEPANYKFVDVHLAWLKFSDDSISNYYEYEITHNVTYTTDLKNVSPENLLDQTFVYDNGFRIDSSNLIEFNSQIESFDSVIIPFNDNKVKFSSPELNCCELIPLSLKFTKHNYPYICGIMTLAFKDLNGNLSENMEFPVKFRLF